MSGGILQLVAYGAQDVYLTGEPQITFFKTVYRRHTMFSMESIQQTFNGQANLGSRITSTISRNGDLLHSLWITAELTSSPAILYNNDNIDNSEYVLLRKGTSFVKNVGHGLLKKVELEIGGQVIDRQYSDWLQIWSELTVPASKQNAYNKLTGLTKQDGTPSNVDVIVGDYVAPIVDATTAYSVVQGYIDSVQSLKTTLYIPLQFWFCRNAGLALPLIALQYHEVKINIELASLTEISYTDTVSTITDIYGVTITDSISDNAGTVQFDTLATDNLDEISEAPTGSPVSQITLWADYIYLDVDERKRFAQVSHEYLIDQLQFVGSSSIQANALRHTNTLTFNHPVKELLWVFKSATNSEKVGQWLDSSSAPVSSVELKLNGHDRFTARPGKYFNAIQPFQHHSNCPAVDGGLYLYSFALKPEEHQPSGTCNFSRIDNAQLNINATFPATSSVCKVFATNYNILRIISGMGGLAYSN